MNAENATCTETLKAAYSEHLFPSPRDYWWRDAEYSEPLLVQPLDEYFEAKHRLAFIGQQTNGWFTEEKHGEVDTLMTHYEAFVRDRGRRWRFQQMAQDLANQINGNPLAVAWTNLYRFDQDNHAPNLPRAWRVSKRVLGEELKALRPQHVVFAVGANYTWELRDFLEEETDWKYMPGASGKRVLGTIRKNQQTIGVHMAHPNARIKGPLADFVTEAVDALGIESHA